ncbi:hypothetical protein TOT_030000723 [Theileria orientalis strain Shintoku]|uniref:Uncharacterized protein n=1 Tax=Theileria orientalis strain Shintoku TaxID=869250 RepID=J4CDN7_THEOR|nr:hypothetical protein TOT_030000723 [Theileria orientalis strain Shintoku]PVC53785.1 hypothetical protein MACL_00003492 [Theileria orientalis]BAM41462.1 hypothetical protein TOT_030000723 [Theileria orientalis strain Shintoku]|eukprot:XP_009691763.1 hypothetical protein TOT_030000723 [Theileria orientalis strain Shintoku]
MTINILHNSETNPEQLFLTLTHSTFNTEMLYPLSQNTRDLMSFKFKQINNNRIMT